MSPYSTRSFFTMPLALDFTSTFVIGVTLPVATTLLAKSPFSTFPSFVGSILVPPRVKAKSAPANINRTAATMPMIMIRLRRFFLPLLLPFTSASYARSNSSVVYGYYEGVQGFVPQTQLICSGLLGTPVALDRETREMEAENLLTNFYAQEGESQR